MFSDVNISNFLKDGKLKTWPSKNINRKAARLFLINKIENHRFYSEKEINELLNHYHLFNDPAFLRRDLCDNGYLLRDKYGYKYWKNKID